MVGITKVWGPLLAKDEETKFAKNVCTFSESKVIFKILALTFFGSDN